MEDVWTCANESKYVTRQHCEPRRFCKCACRDGFWRRGPSEHRNDPMYNMAGPQGPPLVLGPGLSSSSDPWQASGMGVDPLQGPGDPSATTTPWISFSPSPGTSPAVLQGSHSRNLANWKQWTEWQLSCHIWNSARVVRFWSFWPWGPSTGNCHSSRPSDGTDAAPTDANPGS